MNSREIVKCSLALFQRYGIKSVTMDDIAQKLSISKRTLYEHFLSKRTLVEACIEYSRLEQVPFLCNKPNSTIIEIILGLYQYGKSIKRVIAPICVRDLKSIFPEEFDSALQIADNHIQYITERIQEDQNTGLIRRDVSKKIVVDFLTYYIREMLKIENEDLVEVIPIFLRGICTLKGLEIVNEKLKESDQ